MMMQDTVKDTIKAARDVTTDDVLSALGLERRRGAIQHLLPALGYFAAGLVIGTGVALLVAPKTGRQMRRELGVKARDVRDQIGEAAERVTHEVQNHLVGKDDEPSPAKRSTVSSSVSKS